MDRSTSILKQRKLVCAHKVFMKMPHISFHHSFNFIALIICRLIFNFNEIQFPDSHVHLTFPVAVSK